MKTVTLLIPTVEMPDVQDIVVRQIKNISSKLKEKCSLKLIWVVFWSGKITELKSGDSEIVDFHNYKNALEVLEIFKPDVILIHGQLQFDYVAFTIAGRLKKIPIATLFFFPSSHLKAYSRWMAIKWRFRRLLVNKTSTSSYTRENEKTNALRSHLKKFSFLLKTVRASNYSLPQYLYFIFYFSMQRMTRSVRNHKLVVGDVNFCFYPEIKKELSRMGVKESTLFTVGNPSFDEMFSQIPRKRTPPKSHKTKILFCPAPMYEHGYFSKHKQDELITNVVKEILEHVDFEITIKVHPTSSIHDYSQLLKKINTKIPIYQKENLNDLMNQHHVIISYGPSSVFLQAALFKIPIVSINFNNSNENFYFDDSIMTACNTINDLITKINDSVSKKIP